MKPPTNALLGLGLWVLACLWMRPPLMVVLLLVGPLVVVPLALAMVPAPRPGALWEKGWRALRIAQVPAAIGFAVSFSVEAGLQAVLWTLPWLAFASLLALAALVRFLSHRMRPLPEVAIDAGLAFLFVGAFWLAVSRSGQEVLGFGDPIALLTAAHFNLAGIAVPILAAFAARRLPGRLASLTCFGAISGLPVVAVGITLQAQGVEGINTVAVAYFVVAMLLLALMHARLAMGTGPVVPRALWGVAAATLPVGMALAMLYASSELTGYVVSIDTMVRTHAILNVFGFTLPALLAWWAMPDGERVAAGRPTTARPAVAARA